MAELVNMMPLTFFAGAVIAILAVYIYEFLGRR